MIKFCNWTYKVGIKFSNWNNNNKSFNHPFTWGLTSNYYNDIPFSYYWFHYFSNLKYDKLSDVSYQVFNEWKSPKSDNPNLDLDYAYHLDSNLLWVFLKNKSLSLWVKHLEWKINDFSFKKDWFIDKLFIWDKIIKGDLFFDCSWFKSIILSKFKWNNFNSYSNELFCDSAMFCRTKRESDFIPPYTDSIAMNYGWRWKIPLYDKDWNWYVYSSKYISKNDAEKEFRESLWLSWDYNINHLNMKLGRYDCSWINNCIWIWSSYGFIEPLEATGVYMLCKQLEDFLSYFEESNYIFDFNTIDNYNNNIWSTLDSIKDFIVLHYSASNKSNTSFWKDYDKENIFSPSFLELMSCLHSKFPSEKINHRLNSLFKYESYTRILLWLWFYDNIFKRLDLKDQNIWIIKKDICNIFLKNKKIVWDLENHKDFIR